MYTDIKFTSIATSFAIELEAEKELSGSIDKIIRRYKENNMVEAFSKKSPLKLEVFFHDFSKSTITICEASIKITAESISDFASLFRLALKEAGEVTAFNEFRPFITKISDDQKIIFFKDYSVFNDGDVIEGSDSMATIIAIA